MEGLAIITKLSDFLHVTDYNDEATFDIQFLFVRVPTANEESNRILRIAEEEKLKLRMQMRIIQTKNNF